MIIMSPPRVVYIALREHQQPVSEIGIYSISRSFDEAMLLILEKHHIQSMALVDINNILY
jgi:hypothetical protein